MINHRNLILFGLISYCVVIISLSIIGGIINFSPIPHWDMWNGSLGFYERVRSGDIYAWWDQHNEHRIILARVLFFIDYYFFQGRGISLVVENYLFVASSALVFWSFLIYNSSQKFSFKNLIAILLVAPWLFFWSQENNLTWGFQGQFFLAQLLPLLAFYNLAKSTEHIKYFYVSIIFGELSLGTMANGLLVVPLMLLYCIALRQGVYKNLVLLFLALFNFIFYFLDFDFPVGHGHLLHELSNNTFNYFWYITLYLGSPFYFIFGASGAAKAIATIAGLFIIATTFFIIRNQFKGAVQKDPIVIALIFFILFIFIGAFLTAGGRLNFGVDQALSSRYTTPAIMAFSALFIIFIKRYRNFISGSIEKLGLVFLIVLSVFILKFQIIVFKPTRDIFSVREVAALALALEIKDDDYIGNIFPNSDLALEIAKVAVKNGYSIFGSPPYLNLKSKMGSIEVIPSNKKCLGNFDGISPIQGNDEFQRISGWISDEGGYKSQNLIKFFDPDHRIVGYALTGTRRPDINSSLGEQFNFSGFRGFISSGALGKSIVAHESTNCILQFNLPDMITRINKFESANPSDIDLMISTKNIVVSDGWGGADFYRSKIKNYQVFGTFINSDSDVGKIIINAKKGDKFLYRSGPTAGKQKLEIVGTNLFYILPPTPQWSVIEITGPKVPDKFKIVLTDSGSSWGEWSAIALHE